MLAGAGAVYLDSALQRRLWDIMVLGQHAVVQQRQYASVGAHLLGNGAAVAASATARAPEPGDATASRLRAV